ncbi:MAG: tetratricopeptide repeat protein [Planctomycetes bacterium]|nr:tetratricopeptide repeat protein [Planctomycetota bacterium]
MKAEIIAIGTAMAFLGFIAGWIIGSQQARTAPRAATAAAQSQAAPAGQAPKLLDQAAVQALRNTIDRDARNATARMQLANLYFDSERYDEAIKWYEDSLAIDPKNADCSTDLGVSYYYLNQPDRALKQFDHSLSVDPRHTKTMFNMGIVRAFGKQDLQGAAAIWKKLIEMAPDGVDGQNAKRALDGLKSAHPEIGGGAAGSKPGNGS